MSIYNSPLRYPGGKAALSDFLAEVLVINDVDHGIYIEPYAGGSAAALQLLFSGNVDQIILNDADPCIFAFWNSILTQKSSFLKKLTKTRVTINEWKRQRDIYQNQHRHSRIKVAFASFF